MYGLTRGQLNNNPTNIRISEQDFAGEIVPSQDADFKQFNTAVMGMRAGARILGNYYKLHGLSTIQGIISRWAPGNENDTASYISDVCRIMAVGADDILNIMDPKVLSSLLGAVIYHENGVQPYTQNDIELAVDMAFPTAQS